MGSGGRRYWVVAAGAALWALAPAAARAQDGENGGANEGGPAPVLGGPVVEESPRARTLVAIDFGGRLRRLETVAEQSALDLVALDEATREKVGRILGERARIIDDFVAGNIQLLNEFQTAGEAKDFAGLAGLLQTAWQELRPLRDRGALRDEVVGVLPAGARREYERIVDEYYDAVIGEARETDAKWRPRLAILAEEHLRAFGQELGRSFQRLLSSGEYLYRVITEGVELSDEQAARVRGALADFVAESGGSPTKGQIGTLLVKVLAYLSPEQAGKLLQNARKLGE